MSLATKETLLTTLGSARIALYFKDVAGHYQFINQAGADQLESTIEIVTRSNDFDFFAPRTADLIRLRDMNTSSMNELVAYETRSFMIGQPEPVRFFSAKRPMRTARGAPGGIVGVTIRGDHYPGIFAEACTLLTSLVRVQPEELLAICRRGARLKLI